MGSAKPLITFVAEEDWVKRVDDYRFDKRFTSRAEAIRWLVEWAIGQNPDPAGEPGSRPGA